MPAFSVITQIGVEIILAVYCSNSSTRFLSYSTTGNLK
jgi:hypothetical protein